MCIVCFCAFLWAQKEPALYDYKNQNDLLKAWYQYCNNLVDSAQYKTLITAARRGIGFTTANDVLYKGRFYYLVGYGYEYAGNHYDSATHYYEMADEYAHKSRNLHDETNALMRLNYMYYSTAQFRKRDSLIGVIKQVTDTSKNIYAQAVLNGSIGEYYLDRSEYENFIYYKLKAIDYRKQFTGEVSDASNRENIGISYLQIAGSYLKMKQPQKAIEYLGYGNDYLTTYREGKSYLYNQYIEAYTMLQQTDSAKLYYKQVYGLMNSRDTLFLNLSYANRVMADYELLRGKTDSAFAYAQLAKQQAKQSKDEEIEMEADATLAAVFYKKAKFNEAIQLLNGILPKVRSYDKEIYKNAEQNLSLSYAALGDFSNAYLHLQNYSRISDSLNEEAAKKNIAEAEARYQNKEKGEQIKIKNKELALARTRTLWMITGLTLVAAIAILLGFIYRNKRKTATLLDRKNKKLAVLNANLEEANATKARLFSIISHDLRSPISQVYQFLKLQQLNPKLLSEEQKNQLNQKIQEATASLLETMEDLLLWSKTQMAGFETKMTRVDLLPAVEQCLHLLQLNSEAKSLRIKNEITTADFVYADVYFLQTILRNLLQNAIKASPQNGCIEVCFYNNFPQPKLLICNEGKPFTQLQYQTLLADAEAGKSLSGLGLRLVNELSQKMGATVSFSNESDNSTCATVLFAAQNK